MASKKEKATERVKRVVIGLDEETAKAARMFQAKLIADSGGESMTLSNAIKIAIEQSSK